jgi:signal transduction histidine kinase
VKRAEDLVAMLRGETAVQKQGIQVLLIEDNAADALLLRQMFSKESADSFQLTHLTRMSAAEDYLRREAVDICLLDMGLPDGHGIGNLRRVQAAAPGVVVIVLTGLEDELLAAEAIKEGAQDYLIKGQIENRALPRALRHAIERQRMQVETEVIRNNQLKLRDEFLSHVSHELRSPLTSIYSFSTIIADGLAGELNPQQNEYLQIILRNVHQLQSMIEDLLEVTQARAGKLSVELQSVSVEEAIVYAIDTLRGIAAEKEIALSFRCSRNLPPAYADATRLRQILTILLDNALKFTPAAGSVNVEAGVDARDQNFLLVKVADTGCGIPVEATERIFEQLYQVTDPTLNPGRAGRRGLGLGLHIARELVTRLGGEIWVTSEAHQERNQDRNQDSNQDCNQGSQFFFTLPIFPTSGLGHGVLAGEKQGDEKGMSVEVA